MKLKIKKHKWQNFKTYFYLITSVCIIGVFAGKIVYQAITDRMLASNTIKTRAEIIDEKNYLGNSPVSHEFAYSYRYAVNGETFKGNSLNPKLKPGDTLIIAYVQAFPSISKVVE